MMGAGQFNSFTWRSNLTNLVLSNESNNLRIVIQMALKWIFFAKKSQKLQSICDTFEMH